MRKLVTLIRSHHRLLSVSVISILAGVLISNFALVRAAIPASDGTIHGCRNTTTTMLRVIDNASQTCDSNETNLNWDQKGVKAYGHLAFSNNAFSIDTNRSYNLSNLHETTVGLSFIRQLCFTVPGNPKNISATREDASQTTAPIKVAVKDENGWSSSMGAACDAVDSTTNVYVQTGVYPFFLTIH